MKVWVIGVGQYSDFHIKGVVSSRAIAASILRKGRHTSFWSRKPLTVQEFDIDSISPDTIWFEAMIWLDTGAIRHGIEAYWRLNERDSYEAMASIEVRKEHNTEREFVCGDAPVLDAPVYFLILLLTS